MGRRFAGCVVVFLILLAGCRPAQPPPPAAVRLVDEYEPAALHATPVSAARHAPARTEWRFDGAAPADPAVLHDDTSAAPATRGWQAGPGVRTLAIHSGRLTGVSGDDFPVIHLKRTTGLDDRDQLHSLQIRMRVSAGRKVSVSFVGDETIDLPKLVQDGREFPWLSAATLEPGDTVRTYELPSRRGRAVSSVKHILIRPTDAAGATFEIESIRLVTRREHLATLASGVGWQGLSEIYRESLVARAAERIDLGVRLPDRPWLDLNIGTVDNAPVTFSVSVKPADGDPRVVLERTVTTPQRWERAPIDLAEWAGRQVTLSLSLASDDPGSIGLWGSPVVRGRRDTVAGAGVRDPDAGGPPQGVIVIWSDTTRRDHLSMYGYGRETAPALHRLAGEGALFTDCIAQATWTKVSTPSLFTSLYPTSHTVKEFTDRLPASAHTLAEVYREAGYATLSMSSILFTGAFTNLHQGFEELHESASLPEQHSSKTAREYVDRLLPWLDAHRDVPFFVFLHVSDPHDPYRPNPPYDALWTDPARRAAHERDEKRVKDFIADPLMRNFGMPARAELAKAGIDPDAYMAVNRDDYDGSIRGMDAEFGRLVERLKALGLDRRTVLVYTGDHGEEFLEHGRSFHGQTVYGELTNVPLMIWGPGRVPAGIVVDRPVRIIDIMPTLLEMSGLPGPGGMQGASLMATMGLARAPRAAGGLQAAPGDAAAPPAVSEKAVTNGDIGSAPPPHATEAYAIVLDGWKLVHNTKREPGHAEFELFDERADPLNQRDLSAQHPDVVGRLAQQLEAWKRDAVAGRLKPDAQASAGAVSAEEMERLRSLGYIQ